MPSPSWTVVDAAFAQALALDAPEREVYLASLCPDVRGALDPLLRDAQREFPLIDRPEGVVGTLVLDGDATDVGEGTWVGAYRIEGLVGEGGMGRVYRAHRADGAFDQTVAVKVVRHSLTLAGSDVAARLRRERALLATLDHPGIARLIDGGETEDGVPYLVTEFVDGAPITSWANDRGLGVRERVGLIVEVARAVDHAHRRFVVHRDLKPSNVLVAESDGPDGALRPRPVVLDFGIAKLVEAASDTGVDGSGAWPLTQTGMRLLTPAYAAPELYEPAATVTTAADVYGLGALLYELLTGRRPHDDAPGGGPPTTEPTRPSERVTVPADGADTADVKSRSRTLRGDLDTICLRALHPDPARRYASAAALADDLARYLDGRPVEARPDSVLYVAGRFVRRHRPTVAAAAVALLALVGGLGLSLASLAGEREARAEAEAAAARASEAAGLLAGLFEAADPATAEGRAVTAREALDQGLVRLAEVESDVLRGYLAGVLGRTYDAVGDTPLADSLLEASLTLLDEADAPVALRNEAAYALARAKTQFEPHRAIPLFRRVHAAAEAEADRVLTGRALLGLALAYADGGESERGVRVGRRAVATFRETGDEALLIDALMETGTARATQADGGTEELREAVGRARALYGHDAFATVRIEERFAWALSMNGAYAEALPLYQRALERNRRVYEPGHFAIALSLDNIGHVLVGQGRFQEAISRSEQAIGIYRTHSPHTPLWPGPFRDLAIARNRTGRYADAERAAREGLEVVAAIGELDTDYARGLRRQLGLALAGQGRDGEALEVLGRSLSEYVPAAIASAVDAAEQERAEAAYAALRR